MADGWLRSHLLDSAAHMRLLTMGIILLLVIAGLVILVAVLLILAAGTALAFGRALRPQLHLDQTDVVVSLDFEGGAVGLRRVVDAARIDRVRLAVRAVARAAQPSRPGKLR